MSTKDAGAGQQSAPVALVVAWRQGKGYRFGKVHISAAFGKRLRAIADKAEMALQQRERKEYAIGDEIETDEYMVSPLARRPKAAAPALEKAVTRGRRPVSEPSATTEDPEEFRRRLVTVMGPSDPIGAKTLANQNVGFYAIVRGVTNADRVAYVRHLNPMRLSKPGNVLARLGDTLDALTEPVFAMDERTDLIIRPTDIAIFDKNFFDGLFFGLSGESADLDAIVSDTLGVLPFQPETHAMLVERSRGRKRMRRKMLEIRESKHLENVTIDDFKKALDAEGLDQSRFIRPDGTIFADEADGELLLQILNEDLFHGALSGRSLSAVRKSVRK